MRRSALELLRSTSGAVAPTVALSLFGLIACGGIAFDYARMASMDTELQNAADQAALAAATQLDGNDGACARAAAAAANMVSNSTLMANERTGYPGTAINVQEESTCDATGKVRFWQDIGKTTAATDDSNAKFVEVEVDPRTANFALTPIVDVTSKQLKAIAFAGMNSAICRVPPLMMCNPNETGDPSFTISNYIGDGIRVVANDGGGIYGPGNFGFLDTGYGTGASALRQVLGGTNIPGNCVKGDGVDSETGSVITVRDALNTRFGIYDTGSLTQPCGADRSGCPPSANIRKDLVLSGNGNNVSKLGIKSGVGGNGWEQASNAYPATALAAMGGTIVPRALTDSEISATAAMGYPEDMCHAFSETGSCTGGRIGDGNWDRFAYFKTNSTNYPEVSSLKTTDTSAFDDFLTDTFGTTTPTRYQVYQYEMAHAATRLQSQASAPDNSVSDPSLLTGEPAGISPSETQIDRRVLTVAVINCAAEDVHGHTTDMKVQRWVDVFLVQPSVARSIGTPTENSDIYVEVIGQTQNATDSGAVQLVKKSVPYLIE